MYAGNCYSCFLSCAVDIDEDLLRVGLAELLLETLAIAAAAICARGGEFLVVDDELVMSRDDVLWPKEICAVFPDRDISLVDERCMLRNEPLSHGEAGPLDVAADGVRGADGELSCTNGVSEDAGCMIGLRRVRHFDGAEAGGTVGRGDRGAAGVARDEL